jgi:signal transduction histidine kinase
MMGKYLAIAFILLVGASKALPQQNVTKLNIDSLEKILLTAKDTHRINILNLIARPDFYGKLSRITPATNQIYANEALTLARNINYDKGIANAILNKGILLTNRDFPGALDMVREALPLLRQAGDEHSVAVCLFNIAWCFHTLGDNKKAILYFDSSQHLFEKLGDNTAALYTLTWTGHSYFDLGNYEQSYKTLLKALELAKVLDPYFQMFAMAHLANLFLGAGLPEITIQYMHRILNFYPGLMNQKEARVDWPLSWALERGGEAFLQLNLVDSAMKIAEILHIPFDKQDVTNHLFHGHLYAALHQYDKALPHFKKGYLLAQQHAQISLSSHAEQLGAIYLDLKDFTKATYYAEEALQIAQKIHALLEMKNAAGTLAAIYDETKNHTKAYYYSKLYKSFNDSLASEQYKRKLSLLQVQNELEIEKKQSELLSKENQIRQQQLKRELLLRNILIGGILAATLLGIFIFKTISNRNRMKQELKAFELRNSISQDLHDEVGSTLSSIGFLSSMALNDSGNKTERTHSTLKSINESAHKMLDAMNDIIWNIQPQNDELDKVLVRMLSFSSELLETQKIALKFKIGDNVRHIHLGLAVRHDLLLIFKEAINNLARYSTATEASVNLKFQDPYLTLTISDNGKGFDPDKVKHGNGLNNMQSRAAKIGAAYRLNTAPGQGTTITLQLNPHDHVV